MVIDFGFDGVVIVNGDMLGLSESKGGHLYFTTQAIIMSGIRVFALFIRSDLAGRPSIS